MIERIIDHSWLLIFVCIGFFLDWLAIACNWKRLKPLAKALAMILVIAWTLIVSGLELDLFVVMLILAQLFGLAGDIFLLFSKRWFLWGLVSFMIGHFFYIGMLALILIRQGSQHALSNVIWHGSICAVLWAVLMLILYLIFRPAFRGRDNARTLWSAVQFYMWTLSGLVVLTVMTVLSQPELSRLTLSLLFGGVLFMLSDLILAYDRFVENLNHSQLIVHITYHLAQLCLAIGFLSLFS